MTTEATSLDRLHDLVVPAAAGWWPPAPGWYLVLGVTGVVLLISVFRRLHQWQQNRYRREAIAELSRLKLLVRNSAQNGHILLAMAELLKRTALTAFSRSEVAALSGPAWFAFLDRTGGTRFAEGKGQAFERAVYQSRSFTLTDAELAAMLTEIRDWIRNHKSC